MDMEWRLFATLAQTAGTDRVDLDGTGVSTVGDALDALLDEHPALDAEGVEDGKLREHLRLLVDGTDPFREAEGLDTEIDEDAELALFPPVSGG
jgi:molybdopterin synthase sulfur carrier subunit